MVPRVAASRNGGVKSSSSCTRRLASWRTLPDAGDVFDLTDEASKHDPGIADGLALQRVAMKVASDYFERMWPHEVEYGFHRQNVFISAWAVIDLYLNQLTAGKRFTMQGWALYISNQLAIHDYLWHRAAGA